jgi:tetratricopeptide (TPR) repeat protein
MSSMAGAYRELGQHEKGEKYLLEALEIFQNLLGEDHLNTATCYNNLALNYKKQKKFSKAEENYLK